VTVPFGIDAATGTLSLGEVRLAPLHPQAEALKLLEPLQPKFLFGHRNNASINATIGDLPWFMFLIFKNQRLTMVPLHPWRANPEAWLMGQAAEEEVARFHEIMRRNHGIVLREDTTCFPWGQIYNTASRALGAPAMSPCHGVYYGPGSWDGR
jgi:hypothetical protein